ncbi:transposase, partial [Shigella flexneri]
TLKSPSYTKSVSWQHYPLIKPPGWMVNLSVGLNKGYQPSISL